MPGLTDPLENSVLDLITGVATAAPVTSPLKCALVTVIGTDSAAGTEVTGGSYARQTITFSAASGGTATNSNALTFSTMPACTVVGFEIYDSAATPKRIIPISATASRTVLAGDTVTIAAGAITISLD